MDGTTQKFVIVIPIVPIVWPIQEGTNLTQKEVTTLDPLTTCVETMFKVYLAYNLLIQAIPMCLL